MAIMGPIESGASGVLQPGEADGAAAPAPLSPPDRGGIGGALLVLLALALPFEVPLFRVGPLQITTVELALYSMLAAWGIGVATDVLRGRTSWAAPLALLRRDEMARAAALWAAALVASATIAPSDRGAAWKFVLRSASGIFAFFATRSLARPRGVGRRVLLALVAGGVLSAATAVIEASMPDSAPVWRLFHQGSFDALGLRRASGVFEYPTIAAMYWEAVVPLLIVAPFAWSGNARAARRVLLAAIAAGAILLAAIFASVTRTSLVGVAVACGLLAVLGLRSSRQLPRVAAGILGVLAALSAAAFRPGASDSPLGQRLRWWHDGQWFGVQYELPAGSQTVDEDAVFEVPITLRNTGPIVWRKAGALPTRLSYHWSFAPAAGPARFVVYDGLRTELPGDVPPGGVVHLVGVVRAPPAGGVYRLSWDLVQENVTWFSDQGNPVGEQSVDVRGAGAPPPTIAPPTPAPPPVARRKLWGAAVALWRERPLLGIGPDNFRRRYEALLSSSPGGAAYTDTRLHANSLYFETLADLGLAGLAALAGLAVALLRSLRRHWLSGCFAGLGCAVAGVAFFVHGLLDYFFEFTPLFGLFWVTLGLTAAFEPELPASRASPGSTP